MFWGLYWGPPVWGEGFIDISVLRHMISNNSQYFARRFRGSCLYRVLQVDQNMVLVISFAPYITNERLESEGPKGTPKLLDSKPGGHMGI